MLAIALGLTASLSWGCADFLSGLKSRTLPLLTVMLLSQLTGLILIAVIVAARGRGAPGGDFAVWAALSAVAGLAGLAAFYRGLSVGAMAVVAPVSGLAAGVPVVFGLVTGERPGVAQGAGIALALAGVALAARERAADEDGAPRVASGVGLALIAALGFGTFFVLMDQAGDPDPLWAILANRVAGVTLLVAGVAAARPQLATSAADGRQLVAAGLLDMAANTLYVLATREGLVSIVAVLASLYPVVVIALAHMVLGERLRASQAAGVALALGGVVLISAG
ncbi:MAG: EamA family transporter [Thermoleophilaceae bacterium]